MIVSVVDDPDNGDSRVTVTLDWADRAWEGHAAGPGEQRVRLAGEATLDAVSHMVEGVSPLELLAIASTGLGPANVALAQVRYGDGDVLVGSAIETEPDDRMAAVRAVMDAINRRLERDL